MVIIPLMIRIFIICVSQTWNSVTDRDPIPHKDWRRWILRGKKLPRSNMSSGCTILIPSHLWFNRSCFRERTSVKKQHRKRDTLCYRNNSRSVPIYRRIHSKNTSSLTAMYVTIPFLEKYIRLKLSYLVNYIDCVSGKFCRRRKWALPWGSIEYSCVCCRRRKGRIRCRWW